MQGEYKKKTQKILTRCDQDWSEIDKNGSQKMGYGCRDDNSYRPSLIYFLYFFKPCFYNTLFNFHTKVLSHLLYGDFTAHKRPLDLPKCHIWGCYTEVLLKIN